MDTKRIVLTTFGSLGDLHPFLALGSGLRRRGHSVTVATHPLYRDKVESEGLAFHPVRPDLREVMEDPVAMERAADLRRGTEFVLRELVLPHLRASFEDLREACARADLLVTHPLTYAGPLLAEAGALPWLSTALQPLGFFSAHDPPVLAPIRALAGLRRLGPALHRPRLALLKRGVRSWAEPVERLRADLGLPRSRGNPLFEGQFSPWGTLALYSRVLGAPQPDWPPRVSVTGFAFYDELEGGASFPDELDHFLDSGPAPVVFTLGSAAGLYPGTFYPQSVEAARRVGRRAVLLVGHSPRGLPATPPERAFACAYAPHSRLFPRAAAVVHHGGIGTTGQALRAGRPMLIVPYSHDQPDNARRIEGLGVGASVSRERYRAPRVARALRALLADPTRERRCAEVAGVVQSEEGVAAARQAVERALGCA